jgi:hypothetical protein
MPFTYTKSKAGIAFKVFALMASGFACVLYCPAYLIYEADYDLAGYRLPFVAAKWQMCVPTLLAPASVAYMKIQILIHSSIIAVTRLPHKPSDWTASLGLRSKCKDGAVKLDMDGNDDSHYRHKAFFFGIVHSRTRSPLMP